MTSEKKSYWPLISHSSVIIFVNVTVFTILNTQFNFPLHATTVIIPIVIWPTSKLVLENLGYMEKIKRLWYMFPDIVHKGISIFCLFWSGYFILKVILPVLKKDYAKD